MIAVFVEEKERRRGMNNYTLLLSLGLGIISYLILFIISVLILRWIFKIDKIVDLLISINSKLSMLHNIDRDLKNLGEEKDLNPEEILDRRRK